MVWRMEKAAAEYVLSVKSQPLRLISFPIQFLCLKVIVGKTSRFSVNRMWLPWPTPTPSDYKTKRSHYFSFCFQEASNLILYAILFLSPNCLSHCISISDVIHVSLFDVFILFLLQVFVLKYDIQLWYHFCVVIADSTPPSSHSTDSFPPLYSTHGPAVTSGFSTDNWYTDVIILWKL